MKLKQLFRLGLLALCCFAFVSLIAQKQETRSNSTPLPTVSNDLFQLSSEKQSIAVELEFVPIDFDIVDINRAVLSELIEGRPKSLRLSIPSEAKSTLELELEQVDIFSPDFIASTSTSTIAQNREWGLHYRGKINGIENSLAAISLYGDEIIGLFSSDAGNFVIGQLKELSTGPKHIIYKDAEIMETLSFECATEDDGKVYTTEELADNSELKMEGNCVNLYFEIDFDIFENKGGLDGALNFMTGMYNQIAIIYDNESIETRISEIFVWDEPSPYSSGSSSGMLNQFQNFRTEFNGDLGQLVSYQASGGIAAGFNGICNEDRAESLCFSSINTSYQDFPTYSWNIMVLSHEFGHIWGSRHTHACVWNGNGTAIDGCSGFTEGSCPLPGNPPQGGTIMSYCHFNVGINFNEGFGPQPGNVIRGTTMNGTCLNACASCDDGIQNGDEEGIDCGGSVCPPCEVIPTCDDGIQNGDEEGVDCGGPDCEPCDAVVCDNNGISININFDRGANETTWQVTDNSGNVVASGGPYTQFDGQSGQSIDQNVCLPDACYTFTIFDSAGNGICCRRGDGSYTVTDYQSGGLIASGNVFGSSESTGFCLGNIEPTCDDGIQNGDEEGIDCGGSVCPPCEVFPTCDDGEQKR